MKKKVLNLREILEARAKVSERINAICDVAEEREDKAFTDAEKTELEALKRELAVHDARIAIARESPSLSITVEAQAVQMDTYLREILTRGSAASVRLERSFEGMQLNNSTAAVPLTLLDIIQPLEKGLIYHLLGVPVRTGLAGDYCWPVLGNVEASIAGETVKLADSKVELTKLTPEPVRIGISIPVTNTAITQTQGVVLDIIKQQIPLAVSRTINRAMFCTEKFNDKFYGPFAGKAVGTFAGQVPTYKELLAMRADVYKTGVTNDGTAAYVMSESMKAILEATPIDSGSGRMVVENNRIAGIPVFCTEFIDMAKAGTATATSNVGFGIFGNQPLGQFGETRFVVDPLTGATEDVVRLTLNAEWSMTTLRTEAFVCKKCKA